jgi:hypothetical protein
MLTRGTQGKKPYSVEVLDGQTAPTGLPSFVDVDGGVLSMADIRGRAEIFAVTVCW